LKKNGTKSNEQWYLKVSPVDIKGKYKSVYFQCGQDEELCKQKEKDAIDKFGDTIETFVFYGKLADNTLHL
jgi:hypothetical protein